MLVSIRSRIEGAALERICVVVAGVPYAPRGRDILRPGETSPRIELDALAPGKRGAVYFELSAGPRTLRFVTDELFDVTPGAVVLITISDDTVAHVAPVEVEGAVARLSRARNC